MANVKECAKLRDAIIAILHKRDAGKTCCPSEAARKVDPANWRGLMDDTRAVAKVMRKEGIIEICQRGEPVLTDQWTGPVRLRLKSNNQHHFQLDSTL